MKNLSDMSHDEKLKAIWRSTHDNFRGKHADGTRCVLVLREGGTHSVPLECLTESEVAEKSAYAIGWIARDKARKAAKAAAKAGRPFTCGDGESFPDRESAIEHANTIHRNTGNFISVEYFGRDKI